ncbi:hypothetical protein ABPG75_009389 [Micractinium tetrahymenae]
MGQLANLFEPDLSQAPLHRLPQQLSGAQVERAERAEHRAAQGVAAAAEAEAPGMRGRAPTEQPPEQLVSEPSPVGEEPLQRPAGAPPQAEAQQAVQQAAMAPCAGSQPCRRTPDLADDLAEADGTDGTAAGVDPHCASTEEQQLLAQQARERLQRQVEKARVHKAQQQHSAATQEAVAALPPATAAPVPAIGTPPGLPPAPAPGSPYAGTSVLSPPPALFPAPAAGLPFGRRVRAARTGDRLQVSVSLEPQSLIGPGMALDLLASPPVVPPSVFPQHGMFPRSAAPDSAPPRAFWGAPFAMGPGSTLRVAPPVARLEHQRLWSGILAGADSAAAYPAPLAPACPPPAVSVQGALPPAAGPAPAGSSARSRPGSFAGERDALLAGDKLAAGGLLAASRSSLGLPYQQAAAPGGGMSVRLPEPAPAPAPSSSAASLPAPHRVVAEGSGLGKRRRSSDSIAQGEEEPEGALVGAARRRRAASARPAAVCFCGAEAGPGSRRCPAFWDPAWELEHQCLQQLAATALERPWRSLSVAELLARAEIPPLLGPQNMVTLRGFLGRRRHLFAVRCTDAVDAVEGAAAFLRYKRSLLQYLADHPPRVELARLAEAVPPPRGLSGEVADIVRRGLRDVLFKYFHGTTWQLSGSRDYRQPGTATVELCPFPAGPGGPRFPARCPSFQRDLNARACPEQERCPLSHARGRVFL